MQEGWCGEDHLILFAELEIDSVSARYAFPALLPGYRILGLRGWDDFIVQDALNHSIPFPPSRSILSISLRLRFLRM